MSRIDVLLIHPKRTLGVLALVLIAVGIAVGSGANFSASSANPSNTFTAGTLTMSNSNDAAAILTASNWKPGDTRRERLTSRTPAPRRHVLAQPYGAHQLGQREPDVRQDQPRRQGLWRLSQAARRPAERRWHRSNTPEPSRARCPRSRARHVRPKRKHRYKFTATFDSSAPGTSPRAATRRPRSPGTRSSRRFPESGPPTEP